MVPQEPDPPWWRTAIGYVAALLGGIVLLDVAFFLQPAGTGPGYQVGFVLAWALIVVALWLACTQPIRVAQGWLGGFLLAYLALWGYQVALGAMRGEVLPAVTLLVPLLLMAVATKPPTGAQAATVMDVLGWTVAAAAVLALVLEVGGVVLPWDGFPLGTPNLSERGTYWLPLADLFGLNGRWVGPWVHPSLAGPWGMFLVVWGAMRRRAVAYPFLVVGFGILLLTASRTSLVGAIAGLGVAWALHPRSRRLAGATVVAVLLLLAPRLLPIGGAPPVTGGADAASDLAMSGRTGIWPTMVDLWTGSPWVGVGDRGIREAIAAGQLPDWAIQAHNILLDAGVRTGLPGFLLACLIFGLAAWGAVRSARAGHGAGLALLVGLFVTGLTDLTIRWTELYPGTLLLLAAVLLSAPDPADASRRQVVATGPSGPGRPPAPAPARGTGPDRGPEPSPSAD